jgi:hypothetical protein
MVGCMDPLVTEKPSLLDTSSNSLLTLLLAERAMLLLLLLLFEASRELGTLVGM